MVVKNPYFKELELLKQYIFSDGNEDSKRPLLYPLFQKLNKPKFKIESDASGADVYIEGQIIVESKTSFNDWVEGFYQALHYNKKHGLAYSVVMVIAHKFVGIWRVNKLPEAVVLNAYLADANLAPNVIGKINAKKTTTSLKKELQESAVYWLEPKDLLGSYFGGTAKSIVYELHEILNVLKNSNTERIQINTHNFIDQIELLKSFFEHPIDAVHAFYTIVAYWDITSVVAKTDYSDDIQIVGFKGKKLSEPIKIKQIHFKNFQKFIESRYIFTNEGSGLTVDYYFSRFDEVMARIDPEYVKQHGIFFTDINLSKFALWFAKNALGEKLDDQYIFLDPAGGSGNLISSWKGNLKHKIISELQPDLLRIIERRVKIDPWHIEKGFTIIPKTSENKGLNFLDCCAESYLKELEKELRQKNLTIDKPFAFLLNPPYKNTKENEQTRIEKEANYIIDSSIILLTGEEAIKERYLAFLGQIAQLSQLQSESDNSLHPIVMIFTPTSWLFPRPAFKHFRKTWDNCFEFIDGFLITSSEFFKVKGRWPLSFTIWQFRINQQKENKQRITLYDFSYLKRNDLMLNWSLGKSELDWIINETLIHGAKSIIFSSNKNSIRDEYGLNLYDFIRTPSKTERSSGFVIGGLPLKDERRKNKKTYGIPKGNYIGFMDNGTPVRIKERGNLNRFSSNNLESMWFRLDTAFKDINKSKCFNGPTDTRSYCSFDFNSARFCVTWFGISKALVGKFPNWANQSEIWAPNILPEKEEYWYALCSAFVLAENRCVVTKFEKDNPVQGAPEVFVDNPLCPTNPESFWSTTLNSHVLPDHNLAFKLVSTIKKLYKTWNLNYCKGQYLYNVGLDEEPYFKYFNYPDFLTPYSGLIQIRKYAEINAIRDLINIFDEISDLSKKVKEAIYIMLVTDFKYFEE